MTFDMESMLAEINAAFIPQPVAVTDEMVVDLARKMARQGYEFTEETLGLVRAYLSGKGLMLKGDVGVGKSFFFYTLGIPALSMAVAQGKTLAQITKALDDHQDDEILVDDIGTEGGDYKDYGTSVKLLDYILEKRADSPLPTHFTLNLTPEELLARYGERTVDRLTGFAEYHEVHGKSRRDPMNARRKEAWFADFFAGNLWYACAQCCSFYDCDERKCVKRKEYEPRTNGNGEPICPYF